MTLAEFHTLVSGIINRGTSVDTSIVGATRRAARFIERNYTFEYMKQYDSNVAIAAAATTILVSAFTSNEVKRILFLRTLDTTTDPDATVYKYITRSDPMDLGSLEEGRPTHFWMSDKDTIQLDMTADKAYTAQIQWVEFTAWPTDTGESPWLVDNAEDALLARTMLYMAPIVRMAPKEYQMWQQNWAEAVKTLVDAQIDYENGAASSAMIYGAGVV